MGPQAPHGDYPWPLSQPAAAPPPASPSPRAGCFPSECSSLAGPWGLGACPARRPSLPLTAWSSGPSAERLVPAAKDERVHARPGPRPSLYQPQRFRGGQAVCQIYLEFNSINIQIRFHFLNRNLNFRFRLSIQCAIKCQFLI